MSQKNKNSKNSTNSKKKNDRRVEYAKRAMAELKQMNDGDEDGDGEGDVKNEGDNSGESSDSDSDAEHKDESGSKNNIDVDETEKENDGEDEDDDEQNDEDNTEENNGYESKKRQQNVESKDKKKSVGDKNKKERQANQQKSGREQRRDGKNENNEKDSSFTQQTSDQTPEVGNQKSPESPDFPVADVAVRQFPLPQFANLHQDPSAALQQQSPLNQESTFEKELMSRLSKEFNIKFVALTGLELTILSAVLLLMIVLVSPSAIDNNRSFVTASSYPSGFSKGIPVSPSNTSTTTNTTNPKPAIKTKKMKARNGMITPDSTSSLRNVPQVVSVSEPETSETATSPRKHLGQVRRKHLRQTSEQTPDTSSVNSKSSSNISETIVYFIVHNIAVFCTAGAILLTIPLAIIYISAQIKDSERRDIVSQLKTKLIIPLNIGRILVGIGGVVKCILNGGPHLFPGIFLIVPIGGFFIHILIVCCSQHWWIISGGSSTKPDSSGSSSKFSTPQMTNAPIQAHPAPRTAASSMKYDKIISPVYFPPPPGTPPPVAEGVPAAGGESAPQNMGVPTGPAVAMSPPPGGGHLDVIPYGAIGDLSG